MVSQLVYAKSWELQKASFFAYQQPIGVAECCKNCSKYEVPIFVLVTNFATEEAVICNFHFMSNISSMCWKCIFSTNITKAIGIRFTLPSIRHFAKVTNKKVAAFFKTKICLNLRFSLLHQFEHAC